ncbi:hypothetical protein QYE80_21550 [Pseudomonas tohonis]|jgi:outer membrane murein-binding lipoprotein Lpp|nr:hypothetical protein [Pseudomonas tohonis]
MSFNPLISLARNAKRQKMDMQCDPQWVLDLAAERDQLRAELDAIRGQPSAALIEATRELISAAQSVNRSKAHEVRGLADEQPCYWQRKEWIDWFVENGEKARKALDALPPQQPDAVSVLREACDVPLYEAIELACGGLPDGWTVEVGAERGGAWVTLYNAAMEEVDFPSDHERLDYTVNDAIEFAILSTRQTEEEDPCAK